MTDLERLAEACERAAGVLNAHAENEQHTSRGDAMSRDVHAVRQLARALRDGRVTIEPEK